MVLRFTRFYFSNYQIPVSNLCVVFSAGLVTKIMRDLNFIIQVILSRAVNSFVHSLKYSSSRLTGNGCGSLFDIEIDILQDNHKEQHKKQ